jgi:hypothetical protein
MKEPESSSDTILKSATTAVESHWKLEVCRAEAGMWLFGFGFGQVGAGS